MKYWHSNRERGIVPTELKKFLDFIRRKNHVEMTT